MMNIRFTIFTFVASACFAFIGHANMYNDWAQKNAVNLNDPSVSNATQSPTIYPASEPQVGGSHHGGIYAGKGNQSVKTQPSYDTLVQQAKDCFSNVQCATPQSAVLTAASQLYSDMECKGKIEGSYGVYYSKERGYYIDQHDMSYGKHDVRPEYKDCNPKNCSPNTQPRFNDNGDPLVAHVHNHPVENEQEASWPSVADVKSAITDGIDEYVVACSADIAKTPMKVLRVDCRTGRVYLISWPGSENEFERPSQFDKAYGEQKKKSIDQLSDDDFYDPERFGELRDFVRGKKISGANRSVVPEKKTVSNRVGAANSMSSAAADSGVGVRGWCHCWEHEPPGQGVLLSVGEGNLAVGEMNDLESAEIFRDEYGATQRCSGKYSYTICSHCGKCYTSQKVGDSYDYNGGGELTDAVIFNKWYDKAGSEIPTQEYFRMQKVSRDKLLAVPDGHVVIPGKCDCKYPDPVSVALKADEFYVCCFCGRVRLPDKSGGIPIGPTTWRYMMGDKPFPGFQNDKRGR